MSEHENTQVVIIGLDAAEYETLQRALRHHAARSGDRHAYYLAERISAVRDALTRPEE